jgi:thiol-disulfide isomerase/thioredoxin
MKRLLIIVLTLLTSGLYAQQGIHFEHGTWKDVLAKAKAEKKLIFIDIYTSWCGPCKLMAKDIFPLKSVGDKFNANFINFKIDAEKGEGIEIAKTYKVNAYPTYLFVNGDGTLFYTMLGAMSEAQFLKEAANALVEFSDPKPIAVWDAEYPSMTNNKDFLLNYLKKKQKLGLKSGVILDQYIAVAPKEEVLSKETISLLLQQQSASVDGPYIKFLITNKDEIEKVAELPAGTLNNVISYLAMSDIGRAVEKRDEKLLNTIISVRAVYLSPDKVEVDADQIRMNYFTRTKNEKELIKVLDRYGKALLNYDKEKLKAANANNLKRFEEAYAAGQFKDASAEEIEAGRKFYSASESIDYAYRIRALAESALKVVNDKRVLNQAINWLNFAAGYSDNFTIPEVTAGVMQKLGRKADAIKFQEKAIASYPGSALKGDAVATRLQDNLKKINMNKPVWTEVDAPTIVSN